jgi:hypothetical protein
VAELVLASVLVVALMIAAPPARVVAGAVLVVAVLVVQVALRPVLTRRSDRVLAGESPPRSRAHYWYVGLELVELVALLTTGIMVMSL